MTLTLRGSIDLPPHAGGGFDVIGSQGLMLADPAATELGAHTSAYDATRNRLLVFVPGSCRAGIFAEDERA